MRAIIADDGGCRNNAWLLLHDGLHAYCMSERSPYMWSQALRRRAAVVRRRRSRKWPASDQ